MKDLLSIQNRFQDYLLSSNDHISELVVDTPCLSAIKRLDIYKNAYQYRLIDALASNYPVLKQYLETDLFNAIALEYINNHPSIYRSIRWYGDQLPIFLKSCKYTMDRSYLHELAQFEWSITKVFDAADCSSTTLNEIATIPPDLWANMSFKFHQSVYRENFAWNVVPIWQAVTESLTLPEPTSTSNHIAWLLWRMDSLITFRSLSQDEAWALDSLINGANFGDICEGLCRWVSEDEAGMSAAKLLQAWIQSGLITKVLY